MFRSINFLIGLLILLFVLTTLGFSDIALANVCTRNFDQEIPDYSRDVEYEYSEGDSEFINQTSSQFFERSESNGFETRDEFGNSQGSELDYNGAF